MKELATPRGMVKVKPPKEPKEERWQTHVYLTPADFKKLAEIAERESRSVTGQIQHYIRMGLATCSPQEGGQP